MATDLPGLLADAGIRPKRLKPGHTEKLICPKCDGGRTREPSLSLTIDQDGSGATWQCHRGTCGWRDGARVHQDTCSRPHAASPVSRHPASSDRPVRSSQPRETAKLAEHTAEQRARRPEWLFEFFDDRRIGAKTVHDFGIYSMPRRFPDPVGESDAIVFPYFHRGEVVNRKYRPHPAKTPQLQERDALPTLFNVDRLGDAPDEVIFVEGEPDVMALHESGFTNAVTLKDGAPATLRDESDPRRQDDRRFAALATHADLLEGVRSFILAGDIDAPGLALREELARRLGRHRCRLVAWPEGCKDASDVLREHGPEAVAQTIADAMPYPIDGLQDITPGTLFELRHAPPPPLLTTGARATDEIMRLPGEGGRLIVVTGIPNHGKSSWLTFLMLHLMQRHGRRFVVFSPEMAPWQHYAALCAQILVGRPFWAGPDHAGMTDSDILAAESWLRPRLKLLTVDAAADPPNIDVLMERTAAAVLRDGATDLVIDPWNEVEHQRGTLSETDYVGRSLQRLRAFGTRHGINVWIVAHPAKPFAVKPGEAVSPPGLYEISGSAHWANKSDVGITIHNNGERTEVHLTKARFARWGRRATKATLDFHKPTGRFLDTDAPLPHPGERLGGVAL